LFTNDAKNILVADDSIFFREKLGTVLTEAGHNVSLASDGSEVIEKVKDNPNGIDMLVLDLQMPDTDGFETLEWLKESTYKGWFPVLVMTGVERTDELDERVRSLGANEIVSKTCPTEQVIHRINGMLFPQRPEEREEPRVPVSVPVEFTVGDESHTGFLLNMSASGIYLRTREYLVPVTVLGMKFTLPDSERAFDVKGIVKRYIPSTTSGLFGGAGVMFLNLTDEEMSEIRGFVEREKKRLKFD
jgi:DNA-binding response OmpR family regulator